MAKLDNSTPLTRAVRQNQMCLVRGLVEMGENINEYDRLGFTPLQTAAMTRNDEILKFLLESGADIHLSSVNGLQPLEYACLENSIECVQLLVDRGADVNDHRNVMTPLIYATVSDGLDIVRLLISRGDNVNHKVRGAATPLLAAVYRLNSGRAINLSLRLRPIDRLRMRIVQCLIDAGADRRLLRVLGRSTQID